MSKASAITIAIIASVFIGFLVIMGVNNTGGGIDYSAYDLNAPIPADENNGQIADHVRGNPDAEVLLVEYADPSCAMCGEVNPLLESYIESKEGRVALLFRNYPVQTNSLAAASAIEAAGLIKKPAAVLADEEVQASIAKGLVDETYYFEMLDVVFKNRTVWVVAQGDARNNAFIQLFTRIAPTADTNQFIELMSDPSVKTKLNFDLAIGRQQGITGTPSFYLDGEKLDVKNLADIDSVLKPAIEAKLK